MKVFISWSGERSRMMAEALKLWIENFFQTVEVFMSQSDIEPGTRWAGRLNEELEKSDYGIVCLTPENLHSDWILFEAGALSKQVQTSRLTPLLFQLSEANVSSPLSQFQCLQANENGIRKMVDAINRNLDKPLKADKVENTFQVWKQKLFDNIAEIPIKYDKPLPDLRKDREILEEILLYTRNQTLREANIARIREMQETEIRQMNKKDLALFVRSVLKRLTEGLTTPEMIQMKNTLKIAAEIINDNFPDMKDVADQLTVVVSGKKKKS